MNIKREPASLSPGSQRKDDSVSLYDFKVENEMGFEEDLEQHRGKVLLIVNTASKCGFTPQYEGLQRLYEKYRESGFTILGFPCNQFKHQEPGSMEEIKEFCSLQYGVTFPIYNKLEVNGKNTHPLFRFLKDEARGFAGTKAIKWNFTKFLVDQEGNVIKRFSPATEPADIEPDIQQLLN